MKYKDITKLSEKDREKKLKELKMELVKSRVQGTKSSSSKTKEIKKIIARIHTFNNLNKPKELKNK